MTDQPTPESAPVVVQPIPASQSRTLRLTKWLTWLTPIIGFLPDVIGFLVDLWATDPAFAAAITDAVPVQYRVIIMAIILGIVRRYGQLRRDTSQPIIGSPAEAKAMRLVGVALACLLATGCASTRTAAYDHDRPTEFEERIWLGFEAYTRFLDRLFPPRAKPERGGECIGIVWTGTAYRCSESSVQDAGSRPSVPTVQPEKENE